MSNEHSREVTAAAIARAESGDAAAKDALFSALYDELHRLAQSHLRRSGGALTISATTLHEAYLELAGGQATFPDRNRFLGYASRAMRGLVIDYVRHRRAQKRGGDLTFIPMRIAFLPTTGRWYFERLGRALDELAVVNPGLSALVNLKFFCGFTLIEIAAMRGVSERSAVTGPRPARFSISRSAMTIAIATLGRLLLNPRRQLGLDEGVPGQPGIPVPPQLQPSRVEVRGALTLPARRCSEAALRRGVTGCRHR